MAKSADLQKVADEAQKEAEAKVGNQYLRVVNAYVDPTAYCTFRVREDVIKHFGIDAVPDNLAETDVPYTPRKKATTTTTTTKQVTTVVETGAGSLSGTNRSIVGRVIKIPTGGTGITRKVNGAVKQVKEVTIRLPASMTYSAAILWINTCFKDAAKKPSFFKTQAGGRVTINSTFTDKTKLPNKKNETTP